MLFNKWYKQTIEKQTNPIEDQLTVNGVSILISIYIEQRNSVRSSFTKKGINIRIPKRVSNEEKKRQILRGKQWAKEALQTKPKLLAKYKPTVYKNGHIITSFEKDFKLKILYKNRKTIGHNVYENMLEIQIPNNKSPKIFTRKL